MRIRLTQITTRRTGAQARREDVRETDALHVGRGTDNDLSLPGLTVSLHHAVFRRADGEIFVEGVGSNLLDVNGRPVASHALLPGDTVRIGGFELRAVAPGEGDDLALEVEETERAGDAGQDLARRTRLGLTQTWLSERPLVWLAVLAVLLLCVVLPWRSALWRADDAVTAPPPLQNASTAAVQAWSTGPISRPHAQFARECGRCHVEGFAGVGDEPCLACHARIEAHAEADVSPPELSGMTCVACHTEHRGADGLAALEATRCAPCHGALGSLRPASEESVATDFGSDHPQFRLTVVADADTKRRERVEWVPDLQEATGLVFSHVRHVGQAVENRTTGSSEYLRCDACHVEEASGRNYQEVRFATACQQCHALGFDEAFPEQQAFHGDPAVMRRGVLEFYSAVALGALVPPGPGAKVLRAAPGSALSPAERRAALAWAEERARAASDFLMHGEKRCGMCHPIRSGAASDGGDAVAPVEVPRTWLPHAAFSHRSHMPTPCSGCHAAITVFDPDASPEVPRPSWAAPGAEPFGLLTPAELARSHPGMKPSDSASDVSIPDLEDCRACHGGPAAPLGHIASDCVLCHGFHRRGLGPLLPAAHAWLDR